MTQWQPVLAQDSDADAICELFCSRSEDIGVLSLLWQTPARALMLSRVRARWRDGRRFDLAWKVLSHVAERANAGDLGDGYSVQG